MANPATPDTEQESTYVFSTRELQRLAVYRAAVVAGFYTDQPRELLGGRAISLSPRPPIAASRIATQRG